jgi:hypothetical protein
MDISKIKEIVMFDDFTDETKTEMIFDIVDTYNNEKFLEALCPGTTAGEIKC